jgi:hypothetical protein
LVAFDFSCIASLPVIAVITTSVTVITTSVTTSVTVITTSVTVFTAPATASFSVMIPAVTREAA